MRGQSSVITQRYSLLEKLHDLYMPGGRGEGGNKILREKKKKNKTLTMSALTRYITKIAGVQVGKKEEGEIKTVIYKSSNRTRDYIPYDGQKTRI